jgi:hypothetical protein
MCQTAWRVITRVGIFSGDFVNRKSDAVKMLGEAANKPLELRRKLRDPHGPSSDEFAVCRARVSR